jgi:hypothetical protein
VPRPNVAEIGRSNPHSRFCDVRVGILTFNRCPHRAPFPIYPTPSSRPQLSVIPTGKDHRKAMICGVEGPCV